MLAQETTKSHHYLDYIMGPPTHAACPRYSRVYSSAGAGTTVAALVWVSTKQQCRCVMQDGGHVYMTVCVSQQQQQQHWWSALLLAVTEREVGVHW